MQEGARVDHGQDQDDHATGNQPAAVRPAAPDQRGAARRTVYFRPASPSRPSATCTATHGCGSSDGCAESTAAPPGSRSDGATWPLRPGWCHTTAESCSSTPERLRSPGTDTAARRSRRRGPSGPRRQRPEDDLGVRGEPDAVEAARPVRGAGRGNGPAETPEPRPGPTPPSGCSASPGRPSSTSVSVPRG